jgi:hypothetical protein
MKALLLLLIAIPFLAAGVWCFVYIARHPVWAAYIFLATQPFVGGIDRGKLIPLLRPSEAIQFGLMAAVLAGALVRACQGEQLSIRITKLDRAIIVLCVVSSVWPLCWMFARQQIPTSTDMFSTIVLWRLAGLYALFRWVVRTPEQVRRCLWILLVSASLLSMLAILDSLGIYRLGGIWTPAQLAESGSGRGGATLNSAIAVGDYLSYSLAVALVWIVRRRRPLPVIGFMGGIILLGVLGTGQFSAWFELIIVVLVVAKVEGQMRLLMKWLAPVSVVGAVIAWPVLSTRLAGFGSAGQSLLPQSWQGRIDNLTNFYIPRLGGWHWVGGIRPDTVLPAPETWREVIYLESGYLWLFWVGGIPLVLGFLWLLRHGFRLTRQVTKTRADDIGVAAVATRAALWCLLILSLIDPHLTLRGGADLFFCLLGLSANQNVPPTEIDDLPDRPTRPPQLELVYEAPDDVTERRLSRASGP